MGLKRLLLGCFIVFLALGMFLETRDYVLGNTLKHDAASHSEGIFDDEMAALNQMENDVEGASRVSPLTSSFYKLPNGNYYKVPMLVLSHKLSSYLYTGQLEFKSDGVELSIPKDSWHLISTNQHFKAKDWEINSQAGVHRFKSGPINRRDNLDDVLMSNDDKDQGLVVSSQLKKGVIEVTSDGLWLDRAKFKVGMKGEMKSYSTEQAAVDAVHQNEFGKEIDVLKSKAMNFHLYRNQVSEFNEYTVIPVRIDGNDYLAGKFERFTYQQGKEMDSDFEESIDGVDYTLHFEQSDKKRYAQEIKVDDGKIAVEVRGERDEK